MITELTVGTVSLVVAAIVDRWKRNKVFNSELAKKHELALAVLSPAFRHTDYMIFSSTGKIRYSGNSSVDALDNWNRLLADDQGLGWTWLENSVARTIITPKSSNAVSMKIN